MSFDPQMLRLECYKMADRPALAPEVVIENARKIEAYIVGETHLRQYGPDEESPVDRYMRMQRIKPGREGVL